MPRRGWPVSWESSWELTLVELRVRRGEPVREVGARPAPFPWSCHRVGLV